MKAIILAAGKGKRFGETTKKIPKPLIKLGNFTLIEHNIFLLKKYGFNDVVINVSYLSQMIIDYLGDGSKYGISIKYSIEKPEPLETGGGIHNAMSLLGNNIFLVINSA
jgi:MurNAc alpha-1-phosphate uridylyltransferase